MKKSLGRTVKGLNITLHSVGAIFRYMKSNITGDNKKVDNDGSIKMDKMNVKGTIEAITNATKLIIKPGTDKAIEELRKAYVHAGEQINKIDKTVMNIHSKEEFNALKDNLEDNYKRVMNELNEAIDKAQSKIEDTWTDSSDGLDKIKKNCTEYIDRVFNINKNSKNFRSMDKEEFLAKFKFDASKVFDLYKTIPYKNLNEIPIFSKILNNIKINIKEKEDK